MVEIFGCGKQDTPAALNYTEPFMLGKDLVISGGGPRFRRALTSSCGF